MLYFILLFVLGLAFGSFFNVLILRYDSDKNIFSFSRISGRSHCPKCKTTLRWFELLPLFSFLIQKGKCRTCNVKLSYQYPLVETLGGMIFAGVPLFLNSFYGITNQAFFSFVAPYWYYGLVGAWVFVFCIFLLITAIDFRLFIIPNELTALLVLGGLAISGFSAFIEKAMMMPFRTSFLEQYILVFPAFAHGIWNHAMGAIVGFIFFLLLSLITRGRGIGFGDVKLAFAIGLLFGWPDIAIITMLSFIIGGLWSVGLMLVGAKKMKDRVPFAPFFVLGALLVFFFGSAIVKGYFSVFGL